MLPSHHQGVCSVFLALLSCLIATRVTASGAMEILFGQSDFHRVITLGNSFKPLEFLAAFDLGHDGSFEFAFDVKFSLNTLDKNDNRVMLYLLACDQTATHTFLNLPSQSNSSSNNNGASVPPYCAMANRTLDYYCQSFPLENQSTDRSVYHSTEKVVGSVNNVTSQTDFSMLTGNNSANLTFYIDACELLGGNDAILRSCLEYPPRTSQDNSGGHNCFYCPKNYPALSKEVKKRWSEACEIPPAANKAVLGTVAMNLCTADGKCLWHSYSYLLGFYGASTTLWGLVCLVWMAHLFYAPPGSVVALHYKLASVPLTQVIYSSLSFAAKFTAGYFTSSNFNLLAIVTLVAQVVALARSAEVALLVAAGWNITQLTLDRIDVFRIRCVAIEWAIAFVMLKQLEVENIGIVVIWGVSWFSIMFLMYYYATVNLKMLRLRYRLGEQLNIDTSPVMWKGTLFLHYRRLQKGFVFIATVTALTGSDNRWHIWTWISVQGHEILILLLYAAMGYICRCQQFRFSELENLEVDVGGEAEGNGNTATQVNAASDPVSSSSVIPVIDEPVRKKIATVLILNPDKSVMLGTTYAFEKLPGIESKENEEQMPCGDEVQPRTIP